MMLLLLLLCYPSIHLCTLKKNDPKAEMAASSCRRPQTALACVPPPSPPPRARHRQLELERLNFEMITHFRISDLGFGFEVFFREMAVAFLRNF